MQPTSQRAAERKCSNGKLGPVRGVRRRAASKYRTTVLCLILKPSRPNLLRNAASAQLKIELSEKTGPEPRGYYRIGQAAGSARRFGAEVKMTDAK
jgi:hypothetical protein